MMLAQKHLPDGGPMQGCRLIFRIRFCINAVLSRLKQLPFYINDLHDEDKSKPKHVNSLMTRFHYPFTLDSNLGEENLYLPEFLDTLE